MNKEKALDKLEVVSNTLTFLSVDADIADAVDTAIDTIRETIRNDFQREEREEKLLRLLAREMEARIGTPIYWAYKGWSIEKHIVSAIKYDVYHGNFFKNYDGKKVVQIYVEDGGLYLADDLGRTLFFSKEEAEKSLSEKESLEIK